MTNLEELERLHAGLPVLRAETWNHEDGEGYAAIIAVIDSDCDDDEHPGAYDAAVNGVRLLNALPGLIAELRAARAGDAWVDAALPEDDAIKAAHPSRTGDHVLYAEARRLVNARRSKSGLVELVNYLLAQTPTSVVVAELDMARRNTQSHELAMSRANAGLQDSSRRIVALEAELAALREVAEAAREAVRSSIGLTPEATHRIATALAKVPK